MRNVLKVFFGGLLLTLAQDIQAQNTINVVTSAVPFLRISPDARAGGMGDLGVATMPDANAQFYNLAKYPFAKNNSGIGLTYTPWLKDLGLNDVFLASLAGYKKIDETQSISGSLRYFNLGNIEFTDNFGNSLGTGRPRELGLDFGYSRKLSDNLSLGVGLRYINSALANAQIGGVAYKPGNAVAGDLGIYYVSNPEDLTGLSLGLAMTNMGSKISYTGDAAQKDFIPANMTLGAMYTVISNEVNRLSLGMDIHKLMVPTPPLLGDSAAMTDYRSKSVVGSWFSSFGDAPGGFSEEFKEFAFSLGGEFIYNEQFAVRAGYFYENKNKGNRQYFSMGAGFRYNNLDINLSYLIPSGTGVNRNPLSNTIRFSLLFNLGPAE
ncbi:MAG: type IX secretion system outer membrane channel protein PorV [Bacteroidota bacterium]|nr:type IX secretion system outer membrane channel protein PorV [Bacteroidota bacterium]